MKAIILISSVCVDLWEINEREIELCLIMCMPCPPANPSAGPLELSGPHFENHCPKWLIKLLYFRGPYGHRDQRKHLLGGPPRDTFYFYGGRPLTQSPLSDAASLFLHHPYQVSVRHADQSGQVEMTNSTNFPLVLFIVLPQNPSHAWGSDGRTVFHRRFLLCSLNGR